MKCSNCGAEIPSNAKFCEFCGSQITMEMKKEQEQLSKEGCPKCGSSNVTFNREKQGEVKEKKGTTVVRTTVGVCKDCGNTWYIENPESTKKRKTWLWVLGWIFIFPVPLTILMLRPTSKLNKKIRYAIIAIAWIVYIALVWTNKDSDAGTQEDIPEQVSVSETTNEDKDTDGHIYDNAEVRDVMNGTRTEKLGEYAVIMANSNDCTEEAIADVYYNYFEKNDFNWITLIYTDKEDNTGIYFAQGIIGVNDKFEEDEYGDYSVSGSENEIIYAPSDDGKSLIQINFDEENSEEIQDTSEESISDNKQDISGDNADASGVDPELKEFLDGYEVFMNEYCDFMQNYDSSDTEMLLQYLELMQKYADFAEKAELYDSDTMSVADSEYYLEVMTRVNAKLASIAYLQE